MSRRALALIAVVVLLPGCVIVTQPLSDPDKAEPDKALFGRWVSDGKHQEIDCPAVKGHPKGLMHCKDDGSGFWFFTTSIGKHTYWTICLEDPGKCADFGREGAFERWNKGEDRLCHIALAELDGDGLTVTYAERETVKEIMAAEKIPAVESPRGETYFRTAPGWLAKYLEKHGPKKLYGGGHVEEWRREKAP
jgi:hypothetical protein